MTICDSLEKLKVGWFILLHWFRYRLPGDEISLVEGKYCGSANKKFVKRADKLHIEGNGVKSLNPIKRFQGGNLT